MSYAIRVFVLIAARVAPTLAAEGEGLRPGLVASFRDSSHTVRMVVPTPSFFLEPTESIHPALASAFEAEWAGQLSVLQTGNYNFQCAGEVSIDGQDARRRSVALESGRHSIRIRYRRAPGQARLQLEWESEKFPLEPIASSLFMHRAEDTPAESETLAERGRTLLEELGCVNCHAADSGSLAQRLGPNLTGIGSRTNERWIYRWLQDAQAYRSDAVMPAMLEDSERRDVARYLASLRAGEPFQIRPTSRQDVERGKQLFGAIGCAACHRGQELALEGIGSKTTAGALAAFLKDPSRFDPSGRMPSLLLADAQAIELAAFLVESRKPAFEQPFNGGDRARGKEIVRARGCLACHLLEDPAPAANGLAAPPLARLALGRGCLAPEPRDVPRYRLSAGDRSAIEEFLRTYRQHADRSTAPVYTFRRSLERLRCAACHTIDQQAPTGSPAEAAPSLSETGGKLRTRWIADVLTKRRRVLNWLELRMPHFDSRVADPLVEGFAKSFGVEPGNGPPAPASSEGERARGVELLGMNVKKGGMACIGCHDWGEFKSQGESGPQLINAAERLRYDWFVRWMRDPARILSGTSMPSYFRTKTREEADSVMRALWAALALGERMPLPEGIKAPLSLLGSEEKPDPVREPIIVRWDMPEATPAAIAVGMPGRISYCFDAGEVRLRYAWAGGFLDLSGTLYRKTDENHLTPTAKLLGEVFYRADEFPLRAGSLERRPERRFRGYRIVQGYPEFHYLVDGIDVYEKITPVQGKKGLVRDFRIARVDRPMWLVVGRPAGIVLRSSLGSPQNGRISIPRGIDVRFDVSIVKEE